AARVRIGLELGTTEVVAMRVINGMDDLGDMFNGAKKTIEVKETTSTFK
ncbi:MAG: hypothetical protein ACI8S7_002108, partial [Candidatus Krumholzibacteriia bacterium]